MLDKSKIPDIAALDALLTIVKTSLALKVNTSDIIDNLTSQDATKPLSAKQGKTLKDITDAKSDKLQYTTLPTPDSLYEGAVYQFIGITGQAYTKGNWYECKSNGETPATYYWEAVKMQSVTDNALSAVSENPVQNKVINTALGTKQNINLTNSISIDGNVETTVEGALEELNTYASSIDTDVGNISGLIPSTATTQNKLATSADIPGIATINDIGLVKPDGSSIFIDANGVISAASATPIDSVVSGNMSAVTSNAVYGVTNTLETNKQNKTLASPLTINQIQQTTVEGALGGLNSYTDNINTNVGTINAVIPSTATSSNKLVTANDLNLKIREVTKISNNLSLAQLLERFTEIGIYEGEAYITDYATWVKYTATIVSNDTLFVGNIIIYILESGDYKIFKSYNSGSFDWGTDTTRNYGQATTTQYVTSGVATFERIGNIVQLVFNSFETVVYSGGDKVLANNIPAPKHYTPFTMSDVSGSHVQLFSLSTNGEVMGASGNMSLGVYYGTITYIV